MTPNLLQQQPQPQQGFSVPGLGNTSGPSIGQVGASVVGSLGAPRPLNQTASFQPSTSQSGINFGAINLSQPAASSPPIAPTHKGAVTFPPTMSSGANTSTPIQKAPVQTNTSQDLSQYINNSYTTPNGGTITTSGGAGGNVTGYSPSGYSIDTSSSVPSSALTGNNTMASLAQSHSNYADYVQGLAQAQGYSPEYIQALQQQQQAQSQGAALQTNSAALNSNLYTGNNLPGDTMNYAQGATAKAQAQNTLAQSQNSLQQLSANQSMQVQALIRSGNIAAAQSLVQASQPVGVSPGTSLVSPINGQQTFSGLGGLTGTDAVSQWNNLSQQYPGVVGPYDPTLSPSENSQKAQQAVQGSQQFQSQYLNSYSTPGGGTGLYNKLNTGGLTSNQDGTISLVSGAAASLGSAQEASLNQNVTTYNQLAPAFKAANADFTAMNNFMQQAGINQSNIPAVNDIQNKINSGLLNPGAMGAFKSYIASLRTNYGNLLGARGETPTQAGNEAETLIPDDLSGTDMQKIQQALNENGGNILNATGQQISQIMQGLQSGGTGVQSQPTQGNNVGSSWNF